MNCTCAKGAQENTRGIVENTVFLHSEVNADNDEDYEVDIIENTGDLLDKNKSVSEVFIETTLQEDEANYYN